LTLLGVKPPKLDSKVVDALSDEQLRLLIKACAGKGFMDRRDDAIVRLMAETALRAGAVIGMQAADVDLQQGRATVRRGRGGQGRVVPFGAQTAAAVDRYMRARRSHRLSAAGAL
jgi:site-specific recombinase XerD